MMYTNFEYLITPSLHKGVYDSNKYHQWIFMEAFLTYGVIEKSLMIKDSSMIPIVYIFIDVTIESFIWCSHIYGPNAIKHGDLILLTVFIIRTTLSRTVKFCSTVFNLPVSILPIFVPMDCKQLHSIQNSST